MMRKIIFFCSLSISIFASTHFVDAIAIDVNGEPITTVEIQAVEQKFNLSKKAAIELLIKDRLEKSAIEKANIEITPEMLDSKISQIARSRGLSIEQMKSALAQRGLSWQEYKRQLSIEMKKEIFYQKYIASSIDRPSDEDLKLYYETHKDKFSKSNLSQMSLVAYYSNSSKKLREAISNPMREIEGVRREPLLASSDEMNPKLFKLLQNTPQGSFTPPINTGRGFVAYFVKSKSNSGIDDFQAVKNQVLMDWLRSQRVKVGEDFFNKLKDSADIRIIHL